jgi:hypothetical protein
MAVENRNRRAYSERKPASPFLLISYCFLFIIGTVRGAVGYWDSPDDSWIRNYLAFIILWVVCLPLVISLCQVWHAQSRPRP